MVRQKKRRREKEVKLPTEMWAIIAGKLDENDVCSFALVSKQLREAQVLAGRKLVTRPVRKDEYGGSIVVYFTEGWCAYWSRKFNVHHTVPEVVKRVLYVAARQGYLQVFEKYWSQGPQEKLRKLWDEETCSWAAQGGHLEVLQWMRAQDPPCPWDLRVCYYAACNGDLEVLRWARSQGCPWDEGLTCDAARNGHLKVLKWLIKEGYPYDKRYCRWAAELGGERARKVLEWLDE
ncbi:hypothetical protein HKI87_02g16630 [Chloropicon roscoffensis]|uniref:Uncharacterized protein n=1 Tax=Chloropicon roscoffensis TaxID=1461544 RepID=A0AAX4P240_9CHLO